MQIARNQNLGFKKEIKTLKNIYKKETPAPTPRFTDAQNI